MSGYVLGGYLVTFLSLGAYALSLRWRARRAKARPPLEREAAR